MGQLTEIYGPPGCGKTTLALQLAVNALKLSSTANVIWVDTGTPLAIPRLQSLLSHQKILSSDAVPSSPPIPLDTDDLLNRFQYYRPPSLPHLLTFFLHPTPFFPPLNTRLIVVDNISAPIAAYFPRSNSQAAPNTPKAKAQSWQLSRKFATATSLGSALTKMAALHDIAIVVINQVATSLKGQKRAMLKPALSGTGWEASVQNQILIYRDFAPRSYMDSEDDDQMGVLRYVEVFKAGGMLRPRTMESVVAFKIEEVRMLISRITVLDS